MRKENDSLKKASKTFSLRFEYYSLVGSDVLREADIIHDFICYERHKNINHETNKIINLKF